MTEGQPQTQKPNQKSIRFDVSSKDISLEDDGRIRVPVSGLAEDRDGDVFTDDGIDDLVSQIRNEPIPMFPDHGLDHAGHHTYRFYDIMGKWVDAEKDGDVVIAVGELRDGDPMAEQLVDLLQQEMPVGFSIGFGWDEDGATERQDGGLEFSDTDLMEISPVGIPSNPQAVVQAGVQAVAKSAGIDADAIEVTINDAMTENDEPGGEETESEAPDETDGEQEAKQPEDAEEFAASIVGIYESHMEAARQEVQDFLGGEETQAEEGEDEETEAADDDEEDEKVAELRSELEAERESREALETKVAALEDKLAESDDRKGIQTVEEEEEKGETETETNGHDEPPRAFVGGLR